MSLFQKLKNVLFDEEEFTEQIKITPEMRNDDTPSREVVVSKHEEEKAPEAVEEKKAEPVSERELFKTESSFPFFDFDEDEFESQKPAPKPAPKPVQTVSQERRYMTPPTPAKTSLDYEMTRKTVVKQDYGRYEKTTITEEKKKFKPSPIISPVYGILNKDYQKEDIVKKERTDDIDVQKVRDKAFGDTKKVEEKIVSHEGMPSETNPKTTYYEETITVKAPEKIVPEPTVKSIDELLEDNGIPDEIDRDLENTMPVTPIHDIQSVELNNIDNEPLEEIKDNHIPDETEDTLENDLFDLIDSMYDSKED